MIVKIDRIKMEIFLLFSILIFLFFVVLKNIIYSAKRNLFKDQAAWSGKDINIKYNKSKEIPGSQRNENYLKIIADESKLYLEDQSEQEAD